MALPLPLSNTQLDALYGRRSLFLGSSRYGRSTSLVFANESDGAVIRVLLPEEDASKLATALGCRIMVMPDGARLDLGRQRRTRSSRFLDWLLRTPDPIEEVERRLTAALSGDAITLPDGLRLSPLGRENEPRHPIDEQHQPDSAKKDAAR